MAENSNAGGCVWRALADFLCVLTPEQYILLPTVLASNIYCTTSADDQDLISNFLALLGTALQAITVQAAACENKYKVPPEQESVDQIFKEDQSDAGQSNHSTNRPSQTMSFE